ncbi:MAG: YeeE/YedE family protein [Myxococcales bacterium]|nr:YeeE/YedE family protein [Myxococcales bacterium]
MAHAIAHDARPESPERPHWNPYVAGFALGVVLLATFLVMGRGLGASGAMARATARAVETVAPTWVHENGALGSYFANGARWWDDWLVFEVVGVALGGLAAGLTSRRFRLKVEGGPRIKPTSRLAFAFAGGLISGFGARLALGCTSGQALTGGATLALGSWAFMFAVFGGAYGVAYFVRRLWT